MSKKPIKNKGLGRGLSALMSDIQPATAETDKVVTPKADQLIPIGQIFANPNQPRRSFDSSKLEELAASIKEKGIIQPLIVRPDPRKNDAFEIVAGERRWRAAQMAQLHEVPALVREFTETEVLEVAIIENIQRADLNPVDEAAGYQSLMDQFGHTQEQMAKVLGKSRSHIANLLRLLNLPADVLKLLEDGRLTAGHARALVGHDDASELARRIVKQGLSVRDAEKLTKAKAKATPGRASTKQEKDADTIQIERELSAHLGMKVAIQHSAGTEGGKLTLDYKSLEQLDDLMRLLSGQ